jgi:uncharacterized protein YndB with AHSA1/START domain
VHYRLETEIDLPRDRVIELFDNPDNLKNWQPGLESFEHIEGEPGQPGAKSRLHYKMGKRELDLIETVVRRNLPDEFTGTYETKGVWNEVANRFEETSDGRTRWILENEFRFSTLMMKVMGKVMPGAFKKQTLQNMQQFKDFAEGEGSA